MNKLHTFPLEKIWECINYLAEVNKPSLKDIRLTKNGKEVIISEKVLSEWRFKGLNNTDFITSISETVDPNDP